MSAPARPSCATPSTFCSALTVAVPNRPSTASLPAPLGLLAGLLAGFAGADFTLEAGDGFGMWTKFQEGHQGFFRAEQGGVFYDKFYALLALAIRDWGLSFTIDERFCIAVSAPRRFLRRASIHSRLPV